MQALLEFAPLLAFIVTYYLAGVYAATAVLMGAMLLLLIIDYVLQRRIPAMHGLSAVLVFIFGAATLILHDKRFIQWKPTVFCWLAGTAFLGSFWIGKQTLTQRLLSAALGDQVRVSARTWRALNGLWVLFYAALGAANLLFAFYTSERVWVNFKVFGLTLLVMVFVATQVMWLTRRSDGARVESTTSV